MLQVLERCLKSPQGPVNTKASGELRVWVYLYNKEGQTFNVAVRIIYVNFCSVCYAIIMFL